MARRKGGLFLPLDVNFMDDPKIEAAGEKAAWLYVAMCLKSKALLSDGVLTEAQIARLAVPGWRQRLAKCVEVGLVMDITDDTDPWRRYWITGWFKRNESADEVSAGRSRDAERKAVEREAKSRILARDGGRCRYCGSTENLALDHVRPLVIGGGHGDENLQTLCKACNSRKGKRDATGMTVAEARASFNIRYGTVTGQVRAVPQLSGEQVERSEVEESMPSIDVCEHDNPARFCHACKQSA